MQSNPGEKSEGREILNDPDLQNAEQDETGTQAQDVAADALREPWREEAGSEHGGRTNPAQLIPNDAQDLVDRMTDMERSGRIDMDAYEGEEPMDDEDDSATTAADDFQGAPVGAATEVAAGAV